MPRLQAPFPYFGGKSRVAREVWRRLGEVPNYVEPFFGSGAVLLARPGLPGIETVNDLDCFLTNFWRAVREKPQEVARWADYPVSELDLIARHRRLSRNGDLRAKLLEDPVYFDAKLAGWWVWGQCLWIGGGWGTGKGLEGPDYCDKEWRPDLNVHGRGMIAAAAGVGRKVPRLGRGQGLNSLNARSRIEQCFLALAERLRHVRICCGDWNRVLTDTPTIHAGCPVGVFLDPPYSQEERATGCYNQDTPGLSQSVGRWAIEHGQDRRFRIALCGYEGEHTMPEDWATYAWKTGGGMAKTRKTPDSRGSRNRFRERIWFSPYCLGKSLLEVR